MNHIGLKNENCKIKGKQVLTEDTSTGRRKMMTKLMNQMIRVHTVTNGFCLLMSPYWYNRYTASTRASKNSIKMIIGAVKRVTSSSLIFLCLVQFIRLLEYLRNIIIWLWPPTFMTFQLWLMDPRLQTKINYYKPCSRRMEKMMRGRAFSRIKNVFRRGRKRSSSETGCNDMIEASLI